VVIDWPEELFNSIESPIAEVAPALKRERPLIDANPGLGLGLILVDEAGARYTSKAGGTASHRPEESGYFVPLNSEDVSDEGRFMSFEQKGMLEEFFCGENGPWKGHCHSGIDEATADFIDSVLARSQATSWIKVDRTCLTKSNEAWVYVLVQEQKDDLQNISAGQGVLVWQNSKTVKQLCTVCDDTADA
jgi:Family of unknown function (DUF6210)